MGDSIYQSPRFIKYIVLAQIQRFLSLKLSEKEDFIAKSWMTVIRVPQLVRIV